MANKKLEELNKKLQDWGNNLKPTTPEIPDSKMADALLVAAEADERKRFNREVISWFHLAKLIQTPSKGWGNKKLSKYYFFEVMRTNLYEGMLKRIPDDYLTDEEPTQWMIDTYNEFLRWKKAKANTPNAESKKINFENHRKGE